MGRLSDRLGLAFDVLGERVLDSPRLTRRPFTTSAPSGTFAFPDIAFEQGSFPIHNGAIGLKARVADGVLVNFNLRFRLGQNGLSDRVAPLLGIEYAF